MNDLDLTPFRIADRLEWRALTVFTPHRGDDGNLYAGRHKIPLDTWLPSERRSASYLSLEVGIAVVDPETLEDVHDAIRAWCRQFLGREDVVFP